MRVSSAPISSASTFQDEKHANELKKLHSPSSHILGQFKEVKSLIITGRLISEAFRALCKLTELKELDLSQADIPYSEFSELNKLTNLENLKLSVSHLEDLPTCPIPPLRELSERNVCIEVLDPNEPFNCSGKTLQQMPYVRKVHLKSLTFEGHLVPYCFKQLCKLNEVKKIDLSHAIIPYSQFHNIEKLEGLKKLKLSLNQLKEMSLDLGSILKKLHERCVKIQVTNFDGF